MLRENQLHAVLLLSATCAVPLDDLDQPIKHRGADPLACSLQISADPLPVVWVAAGQPQLQLLDRLRVAEPLAGYTGVNPSQDEPTVRRSKTAAEDVVECVEVVPSLGTRDQYAADHPVELFKCGEVAAVDLVDLLRHPTPPLPNSDLNCAPRDRTSRVASRLHREATRAGGRCQSR